MRRVRLARGLALLLLAFGALWLYDRRQGPTGAWLLRAGLREQWADVDGLRLRYVRAGQGSPVLLLHGFASSLYTWRRVLPGLAREHDVVALDFPGFGRSQVPAQLSPELLARAARGLIAGLGLRRPALVGHSMGGAVAAVLASDPAVAARRVALLDAATFAMAADERPSVVRLLGRPFVGRLLELLPLRRASVALGLFQVFEDDRLVTSEELDEYVAPLRRPGTTAALVSLLAERPREAALPARSWAAVSAPALVVWGRQDAWIPLAHAERHLRALPAAKLLVLERCGHMPQEEQGQATLRALAEFLATPAPAEP